MMLFRRQDTVLVAGLIGAVIIAFAAPIMHALDYIRQVEAQTGLALSPALLLLTTVFIFHQLRKRHEMDEAASAAVAAKKEAEARARELERLVGLGQALSHALDNDAIRSAVLQHLPPIVGTTDFSVLRRQGNYWETLAGDARAAEPGDERCDVADRVLAGAEAVIRDGDIVGIPLVAGADCIGTIVLRLTGTDNQAEHVRAGQAAAALLAVSVENAQLFREVRDNSLRDSLTGCATRSHAVEVIDGELRRARRSQMPVSLIMIDVDHFKDINDRYGHLTGDTVLAGVGRRIREVLRTSDLKCRYGGEEFLVLASPRNCGSSGRVRHGVVDRHGELRHHAGAAG